MTTDDFKLMMGNVADPEWHCPRCVEPHFMSGTGMCCCSFLRRGMGCPWHKDEPKMCCSSARVSKNVQKRKKPSAAEPTRRAKLCSTLDKRFESSKIIFVNEKERCYEGFPCERCIDAADIQVKKNRPLKGITKSTLSLPPSFIEEGERFALSGYIKTFDEASSSFEPFSTDSWL
mmetsp:Transcript_1413/g.1944  ORF Transcript_1413/g.1944 Transcript_1413/m.1944 type:complete len:175 (-) Transcript_1413:106-630(-)